MWGQICPRMHITGQSPGTCPTGHAAPRAHIDQAACGVLPHTCICRPGMMALQYSMCQHMQARHPGACTAVQRAQYEHARGARGADCASRTVVLVLRERQPAVCCVLCGEAAGHHGLVGGAMAPGSTQARSSSSSRQAVATRPTGAQHTLCAHGRQPPPMRAPAAAGPQMRLGETDRPETRACRPHLGARPWGRRTTAPIALVDRVEGRQLAANLRWA